MTIIPREQKPHHPIPREDGSSTAVCIHTITRTGLRRVAFCFVLFCRRRNTTTATATVPLSGLADRSVCTSFGERERGTGRAGMKGGARRHKEEANL